MVFLDLNYVKIPFASYSFINLDFLLLHILHVDDDNTMLPLLVFNTFESKFVNFLFFLHFKQCFIMVSL